jgi:tRNA wybutosine-synthesizing protein 3
VEEAQAALHAAVQSGFRESGISGLLDSKSRPSTPMVAVRSSGLALDSVIGFKDPDSSVTGASCIQAMVSESYLRAIVKLANDRFTTNEERKLRFRAAWRQQTSLNPRSLTNETTGVHESSAARKERLRMEGLERKHQMLHGGGALDGVNEKSDVQTIEDEDDYGFDLLTIEEPGSVGEQDTPDEQTY